MTTNGNAIRQGLVVMTRIIALSFAVTLAACVTANYTGKTYPSTKHVDLYFKKDRINQPYLTMGEIREVASRGVTFKSMEQKLVMDAMAKGADAVLIEKLDTVALGSGINDRPKYYVERNGNIRPVGGSNELTIVRKEHVVTAKLLKYHQ